MRNGRDPDRFESEISDTEPRCAFDVLSGRKDRDSEEKNRILIQIAQHLYFGFLMAIIWQCSQIGNIF